MAAKIGLDTNLIIGMLDEIYSVAVPGPAKSLGGYHRSGPGDRG